jgi:hypothetical protein
MLGTLYERAFETPESEFVPVTINKFHPSLGSVKSYFVLNHETREKERQTDLHSLLDLRTQDVYLNGQSYIITGKCVALLVLNPLTALFRIAFHVVFTPIQIGDIALTALKEAYNGPTDGLFSLTKRVICDSACALSDRITAIARVPIYATALELGALWGVFHPFQARKIIAMIEQEWQGGISYREMTTKETGTDLFLRYVRQVFDAPPFYLAQCFQVRDNLYNPRVFQPHAVYIAEDDIPLSIDKVIENMNRPKPSFQRLFNSLTQEMADTPIYVKEHERGPYLKGYHLATEEQAEKPGCDRYDSGYLFVHYPSEEEYMSDKNNHTTTIANIIATNELGFTPLQVNQLIEKLIALKADFSRVDFTALKGDPENWAHLQHHPLKSLIRLGGGNSDYDASILSMIQHIGSLKEDQKHHIFDETGGQFTPLRLLILQGKEDLALEIVNRGAHVESLDLVRACQSFGTTARERPQGQALVGALMDALKAQGVEIPSLDLLACTGYLNECNNDACFEPCFFREGARSARISYAERKHEFVKEGEGKALLDALIQRMSLITSEAQTSSKT